MNGFAAETAGDVVVDSEWLDDPGQSVFALMHQLTSEIKYPVWSDEKDCFVTHTIGALDDEGQTNGAGAVVGQVFNELGHVMGSVRHSESDPTLSLRLTVNKIQKDYLRGPAVDNIFRHWQGVSMLTYLAARNRTDTTLYDSVPEKHRNETPEEQVFRIATGALQQYATRRLPAEQMEGMNVRSANHGYLHMLTGLSPELRPAIEADGATAAMRKYANSQLAAILSTPIYNNKQVEREVDAWEERLSGTKASEETPSPTPEIPELPEHITVEYVALSHTILRPDVGSGSDHLTTPTDDSGDDLVSHERFTHDQLIAWLGNAALAWDPGVTTVQIATINLQSSGRGVYKAALLPAKLPNGEGGMHAVARTRSKDDATFVWHVERGVSDDGTLDTEWHQAFDDTKQGSVDAGVRRMLDTGNGSLLPRVVDFLHSDQTGYARPVQEQS